MKNKIIIIILILSCIGFIMAGSILEWNDKIDLTKEEINYIKNKSSADDINLKIGKIYCDDFECWASVYQYNVINDEWRINKTNSRSRTAEDYQQEIKLWTKKRLSGWVEVSKERDSRNINEVCDKGRLSG